MTLRGMQVATEQPVGTSTRVASRFTQLVRKAQFTPPEAEALLQVAALEVFAPRFDLLREGAHATDLMLVVSGFGFRYVNLPDGYRRIVGFLIPGDLCGWHTCVNVPMDHSVATLGKLEALVVRAPAMKSLLLQRPAMYGGLWRLAEVETSTLRQWLVNIGHRNAFCRLAHLFCEMYTRMHRAGLASGGSCPFPFTQGHVADALAISPVHVNRMLMQLRREGLVTLHGRELTIHDPAALRATAGFGPGYLQAEWPTILQPRSHFTAAPANVA